jgi:L-lactate utilization protein LutB
MVAMCVMGVHRHLQADLARHSSAYVGKVRSNFIGTEFTCYDSGISPAKASGAIRGEQDLHAKSCLVCTGAYR